MTNELLLSKLETLTENGAGYENLDVIEILVNLQNTVSLKDLDAANDMIIAGIFKRYMESRKGE